MLGQARQFAAGDSGLLSAGAHLNGQRADVIDVAVYFFGHPPMGV